MLRSAEKKAKTQPNPRLQLTAKAPNANLEMRFCVYG
jgi:hypothetical protein